jgi:hypothetical protein
VICPVLFFSCDHLPILIAIALKEEISGEGNFMKEKGIKLEKWVREERNRKGTEVSRIGFLMSRQTIFCKGVKRNGPAFKRYIFLLCL